MQQKGIVTVNEHETGEVPHEWFCLYIKVPDIHVAAPSANQLDDVSVDT